MVDATQFFDRPAREICSIYSQVWAIFVDNFKIFALLALAQALIMIPAIALFAFAAYETIYQEVAALAGGMSPDGNGYDGGYGGSNPYGMDEGDDASMEKSMAEIILTAVGLYLGFVAAVICICATFQGAFVRAASEVFAGHTPELRSCLRHGHGNMFNIICFNTVCLLAFGVTGFLWFFITIFPQRNDPNVGLIFLVFVAFIVAFIIFGSGMAAGLPSIVVEGKGPVAAVSRSWSICKSKIGFIFCCGFCFYAMESVGQTVVQQTLSAIATGATSGDAQTTAPLVVNMVSAWLMTLILGPLNATLNPVIYFSLRIQKEGLTMEQLQSDLGLLGNSVELRPGGDISSGIPVSEDPSLLPITKATSA